MLIPNANSPYCGDFEVTQIQHSQHDGLDLVGLTSKDIHATVTGVVVYAGWEDETDHKIGFGQFVCIKSDTDGYYYYYAHLSKIKTTYGEHVQCTDIIGVEGDTGYSFGSHCHYCCRPEFRHGNELQIWKISGIPNVLGIYNDGYIPPPITKTDTTYEEKPTQEVIKIPSEKDGGTITVNGVKYDVELKKLG